MGFIVFKSQENHIKQEGGKFPIILPWIENAFPTRFLFGD